jgi:hypothetical protein
MKMKIGKEIAIELRKSNIKICEEYLKNMMTFSNYGQLASMYFKGSDWSMENDFPNIKLLRKHRIGLLHYGMMTDVTETYYNIRYLGIFGKSDANLFYNAFSVANIIIRHSSKAIIKASGNAIIQVNVLDNAELEIECLENAKVSVYDYGKNTKVTASGNVKIELREWEK